MHVEVSCDFLHHACSCYGYATTDATNTYIRWRRESQPSAQQRCQCSDQRSSSDYTPAAKRYIVCQLQM